MIITEIQYFFSKIIRFQAIFKDTVEFTCALEFKISSQLGFTVTVRGCDGTSGLASVFCTSEVFYPGYNHERNQRIGGRYEENSQNGI